jgi:hypothetical protein
MHMITTWGAAQGLYRSAPPSMRLPPPKAVRCTDRNGGSQRHRNSHRQFADCYRLEAVCNLAA